MICWYKHEHGEENVQMKAHAYVYRWVDRNWLKEFGVVKNMFEQNIEMKKQKKVTKTTWCAKEKQAKQKKTGVHLHVKKNGMCTGKIKVNIHKNKQNYYVL